MYHSLIGRVKHAITLSLIAFSLLLIGCGGGGGGGSSSGGADRPLVPAEVELSIVPFANGLRIQWHNLDAFEQAGEPQRLIINLTRSDGVEEPGYTIAITDFVNGIAELTGLDNGVAYRFTEMIEVEYTGDVPSSRLLVWKSDENKEDNDAGGIKVGVNRDGDSRANSVDTDKDGDGKPDDMDACRLGIPNWPSTNRSLDYDGDGCRNNEDWDNDNDGVNNTRADGTTVWDLCWQGELNWLSDSTNDYDRDGCRDRDEDWDNDNDGVNNTRADGTVWDLCRQGELNWLSDSTNDYDRDGCRDRDEDWDNDNDGVNNTRADGTVWDLCQRRALGWLSDSTNDVDSDGCRNDEDPDGDNDGILKEDEAAPRCDLAVDCDNDMVADIDEEVGCASKPDCDNDSLADSEDACPAGLMDWRNNGTNDVDGDGCRNDEDPDGDNDGILNEDEVGGCELKRDCEDDGVDDVDEAMGCVLKPDCDDDSQPDSIDMDDDGDGLIEIRTAEELDVVRHVLDGTGFKADAGAMLNQTGCGGRMSITVCNGYELVRDIFLTDYIADNYPTVGWEPIASDVVSGNDGCDGGVFTGTFDGNGFEVRGLFINRPREDCIGLFGAIRSGKILNLGVVADRIIGREDVGSLVGRNAQGKIIGSYAVSSEVRGTNGIGGLMGYGLTADIVHSYAVSSEVRGEVAVGGLVGFGWATKVVQSYAVSGEVRGDSRVGGLIGSVVTNARIIQSYGVSGEVRGNDNTGGLVGRTSGESRASASYWDNQTSGRTNSAVGSGQTSDALRSPTNYTSIYDTWDDGAGVEGINDNTTIWCDEDGSGMIEDEERRDDTHTNGDNRVWHFGTNSDYPAIRCTPDSLADQRAWWYLNTTSNKPQLNRTRVNAYLDGTLP